MKRVTVAVDGPAGSGKSTVSREVARRLGFLYIDTGAMYRAVALKARRCGVPPNDDAKLSELLGSTNIELIPDSGGVKVLLDGEDVSTAIRTEEAGMDASTYSKSPAVREKLVQLQRTMGKAGGVVMEGRDIGTVVFPQAECKFYLDADTEERAGRRSKDLEAHGMRVDQSEIFERVKIRDAQDSGRTLAPLKPAPDAIIIDTTGVSFDEVVQKVLAGISLKKGSGL